MRVLVMGGTRFMGKQAVRRLVEHGHEVILFNRGTQPMTQESPVREVHGDRNDPQALAAVRRFDPDAVVDFSAYTTRQTALLLEVLGDVPVFVHCSTGAVYCPVPELPWSEATPLGPWALWGDYAAEKLGCERELAARRAGGSTLVLRLPFVLGPRNYTPREEFVLNRLLDGEDVLVPGDGCAVQHFVHVRQAADAFVAAIDQAPAGWHAFNIASNALASLRGFVEVCAEVAGVPIRIRTVLDPKPAVFDPMAAPFPFPNANYILDLHASEAAGLAPTPMTLHDMIEDALRALVDEPPRRAWQRTGGERTAPSAE